MAAGHSRPSLPTLALGVVLVGAVIGCERGCGSQGARDLGVGGLGHPVKPATSGANVLSGSDCSDGLARCVRGGVLEVSQAAFLPHPCTPKPESRDPCACPWARAGVCASGCAVEDLEVQVEPWDAGAPRAQAIAALAQTRLCRADPASRWRPAVPSDPPPPICADVGVRCTDGRVTQCAHAGGSARVLGVCIFGCDPSLAIPQELDPATDPGSPVISDGVAGILCQPQHAERR